MHLAAAKNSFWTESLRREQLVELLEGRGPRPNRARSIKELSGGADEGLQGIWYATNKSALSSLPQILVAEKHVLDDLFAWSATYLRGLGPLSSVIRLLTPAQCHTLFKRDTPADVWKLAGGAVGLIVGEVLADSRKSDLEGAIAATPNSTLAFAILRAWFLGVPNEAITDIRDGYIRLLEKMQRHPSTSARLAVEEVAICLTGIDIPSQSKSFGLKRTKYWMQELRSGRSVYDVAKDVLRQSGDLLSSQDVLHLEEMTAEDRVRFLDKVAPALNRSSYTQDQMEAAFALALAVFVCRPGFEQQVSLLRGHVHQFPEAWLWLGALQAFSPTADILFVSSGAGLRIARELFRPEEPWAPPRGDAAITEIEMLEKSKTKMVARLMGRARLDIEIYPMITTAVRGLNISGNQQKSETRHGTGDGSSRDFHSTAKMQIVEARLEESLRLLRELRWEEGEARERDRLGRRRR